MPIDPKALDRLLKMGGPEAAVELLDRFLALAERLESLQELDGRTLELAAHRIASDAGWLGANRVRQLGSLVEELAALGRLEEAALSLADLRQAYWEAREPLFRQRQGLDPC